MGALRPPAPDADPKYVTRWRNNVSSTLFLLVVAVTLSNLLALGVIPFLFPGFALANDLQKQVQIATQIRIEQLDTKLFDTRGRQCAAMVNKNTAAVQSETQRLQDKLNEYQDVAKRVYRVPNCDEY